MKLQTLAELNAERAARRPAIVVTDTTSGEQRLVKARDFVSDPLRVELEKALRMGKSGNIEVGDNADGDIEETAHQGRIEPRHGKARLTQNEVLRPIRLGGLVDDADTARSNQQLLHARILEGGDMRCQHGK